MKKISYSAMDKYLTCPKMYDIYYNERLRPTGSTSALAFGSAMDSALNELLLNGKLEKAIDVFRDNFVFENLSNTTWDDRDIEPTIVDGAQFNTKAEYAWACMRVKGRLLLEEYYDKVYSQIEEVESVQRALHNRPGFIDAIVKLRGHGRVLLDNKTSAQPYYDQSVLDSAQLHLYAQDQGVDKIAFAVMVKQIERNTKRICRKCKFDGSFVRHKSCPQTIDGNRCRGDWNESFTPKAIVQLFVANTEEITTKLVCDTMRQVEAGIDNKIYPRNIKACGKIYGKPCPYINYCWKNSKEGLETKPEGEKK